jgi:hypothetical protein
MTRAYTAHMRMAARVVLSPPGNVSIGVGEMAEVSSDGGITTYAQGAKEADAAGMY